MIIQHKTMGVSNTNPTGIVCGYVGSFLKHLSFKRNDKSKHVQEHFQRNV